MLMADVRLEAACQAFTALGTPAAMKRPRSRMMPPFIGAALVGE